MLIRLNSFIRFSVGEGIAGYVAETGEPLNVTNAYSDERFNSAVDEEVIEIQDNKCSNKYNKMCARNDQNSCKQAYQYIVQCVQCNWYHTQ